MPVNIFFQPRLVDTLMTAEKHSHYQNSVNCFRKLLGKFCSLVIIHAYVEFHKQDWT